MGIPGLQTPPPGNHILKTSNLTYFKNKSGNTKRRHGPSFLFIPNHDDKRNASLHIKDNNAL